MTPDSAIVNSAAAALGIFLGSFVSEDAALLGAASLASARLLNPAVALSSAALGICVGDIGLYALARHFGPAISSRSWFSKRLTPERLERAQQLSRRWGIPALAASRFIPGTRLPMTVASGFLKMPLRRFASVSALASVLWVFSVFGAVMTLSARTASVKLSFAIIAALLFAAGALATQWKRVSVSVARWSRWEFWPAWLFYAPVVAMCLRLAVRYRGLSLPTVANLNQKNGGLIGESKAEIMRQIQTAAPELAASTYLVRPGAVPDRMHAVAAAVAQSRLAFPWVFKPDVGQRGEGFQIIRSWDQAREYLELVTAPVVLQQYVPGPGEAGIFYYRFPADDRGHIFAITNKVFPSIHGDGQHTVEELIEAEPRARLMADVYKSRLGDVREIPISGARIQLVEAGNHCQGCIFEDGQHLFSDALAEKIDHISQKLEGFYVGRYDVRYTSDDDLRQGRFTIIELNGASSEATSIYDACNSLRTAYAVLYRQWELVYRIGAINWSRGNKPAGLTALLRDWRHYRKTARSYPIAS